MEEEQEEERKYRCVKRDNLRWDARGALVALYFNVYLFVRSLYLDHVLC